MQELNSVTIAILISFVVSFSGVMCSLVMILKELKILNISLGNTKDPEEPIYFEEPETKNRIANMRIFDNIFSKASANHDPYNEAWSGEADPEKRKKTI